ncbi:MAG: RecQ family ATP-dependent DNA helicase, partial [Prevotella sp.]|nr:RecQ family ATP-dependent DNA helicase [Prevotella sp.]
MIAFFDTEVNPQTKKVADYGVVREDGAVLHTHSKTDFDAFISMCDTLCGHNIINHDMKYTALRGNPTIVDTLFLSPLLFPKRPYHHLVKDDKLQVDELNNPVNDSMKARDLLNDEVAAWNQLSTDRKEIYYQLLKNTPEFDGFFEFIHYTSSNQQSLLGRIFRVQTNWTQLILREFEGKVCSHADFDMLVKQYSIELAYCLAVRSAAARRLP